MTILSIIRAALAVLTFSSLSSVGFAAGEKLNVLFILSDDARPELGCYGADIATPNLDKLAAQSVRFERAYCQYPLCNPSRISMLTGQRPSRTGIYNNRHTFRKTQPDLVTLPHLFHKNGYVAVGNGKVFHGGLEDAVSRQKRRAGRNNPTLKVRSY